MNIDRVLYENETKELAMWVQKPFKAGAFSGYATFPFVTFVTHLQPPPSATTEAAIFRCFLSWPLEVPWSRGKGAGPSVQPLLVLP